MKSFRYMRDLLDPQQRHYTSYSFGALEIEIPDKIGNTNLRSYKRRRTMLFVTLITVQKSREASASSTEWSPWVSDAWRQLEQGRPGAQAVNLAGLASSLSDQELVIP
jgi:hypothetical protein